MSKSRGTYINARPYLDVLDPNYLRFYYATLLGPGPEDLDLSPNEFRQRVNGELVNNICNLASRLKLLGRLDSRLAPSLNGTAADVVRSALTRVPEVRKAFSNVDLRGGMKVILEIGQAGNAFLQAEQPWKTIETDPEHARSALTAAAEIVYLLSGLLDPIVPRLAAKMAAQLGAPKLTFKNLETATLPLLDPTRPVGEAAPIIGRMEEAAVAKLVQTQTTPSAASAPSNGIDYEDFARVDLKVGKVLSAERVPKADKLLKLTVDVGEQTARTIVSGIAGAYAPEALSGRNVVVVTNLKPRKLRGIESNGMLLTAGTEDRDLTLIDPGDQPPGAEVK